MLARFVASRYASPPMRTQSSCRFEPYYKAQFYDVKQLAWRDIQRQFSTPDEARAIFGAASNPRDSFSAEMWRVMEVTMNGRKPL